MAQHRIPRGAHGEVKVTQQDDGRWLARTQVRGLDGRVRSVRVTDKTKGGAGRRLERRLADRLDPTAAGVTSATTLETLAGVWLQHRRDHGKVRTAGSLSPQTLAIYDSEIRNTVIPAVGAVRVSEVNVPFLDRLFADIEHGRPHGAYRGRAGGRSTKQLRVVLGGMLSIAVSHGALGANPMRDAAPSSRAPKKDVEFLTVEDANYLRAKVRRTAMQIDGRRMPNVDLEELVDVLLGTGCREGEALAIRPVDAIDLGGPVPMLRICGTLVEPRRGYVEQLHRQDSTKTRDDRTLILPAGVAEVIRRRIERHAISDINAPVFGTRSGNWISPANMRTRLRVAIDRACAEDSYAGQALGSVTFHTLRRTVGTLLAHEVSLDAAREQLGHRDPSVTYQHYVGKRATAPDVRSTLDKLVASLDGESTADAVEPAGGKAPSAGLVRAALSRGSTPQRPPPSSADTPRIGGPGIVM